MPKGEKQGRENRQTFVLDKVEFNGVVDLDRWVRVTDGTAVVGDEERNTLGTKLNFLDFQELVLSLFSGDTVDGESTLDIVKETEVFTGLLDGDDVWNTE